jgi:hypothetical protein
MTPAAPQRSHDLREVVHALRGVVRAGAPWRRLPHDLPPWEAVDQQTQRWLAAGCCCALGWVRWMLVFESMRTVTSGRDAQHQPIWMPALPQLARKFRFHPEACAPGAGNQKGSVESLVEWVKGSFLSGRTFTDDADLAMQQADWLESANTRPSSATGIPPRQRLTEEATRGDPLSATAHDYGFLHPGRVRMDALVAVLGNRYSVPVLHDGAPVTVRVHRELARHGLPGGACPCSRWCPSAGGGPGALRPAVWPQAAGAGDALPHGAARTW